MLNAARAHRSARVFAALTGLSLVEFERLLPAFDQAYTADLHARPSRPRQRRPGGGRQSVLATLADQLFFLLFYFRHYPTQETLAFLFGFCQGQANQWIHRLTPV